MPLAVIIITLSAASFLGSLMGKQQVAWLAATDRRIKLIVSLFLQLMELVFNEWLVEVVGGLEPDAY